MVRIIGISGLPIPVHPMARIIGIRGLPLSQCTLWHVSLILVDCPYPSASYGTYHWYLWTAPIPVHPMARIIGISGLPIPVHPMACIIGISGLPLSQCTLWHVSLVFVDCPYPSAPYGTYHWYLWVWPCPCAPYGTYHWY